MNSVVGRSAAVVQVTAELLCAFTDVPRADCFRLSMAAFASFLDPATPLGLCRQSDAASHHSAVDETSLWTVQR